MKSASRIFKEGLERNEKKTVAPIVRELNMFDMCSKVAKVERSFVMQRNWEKIYSRSKVLL